MIQEMIYCPFKQTLSVFFERKKNLISFSQQIVEYVLSNAFIVLVLIFHIQWRCGFVVIVVLDIVRFLCTSI